MSAVEPIRDLKTIRKIRLILRGQSIRNELLFILGINVGLRISDILRLKVKDLVKPDGKIRDYVIVKEKKTKKVKKFYIGKVVKQTIKDYMEEYRPHPDMYVFKSRKGKNRPISRQQAYRIINHAAELAGLVERDHTGRIVSGEIGTHTLRKTFGYHAYKNGADTNLLQEIFNHSSNKTTLRYIGITEEQKKEVYLSSNLG
ncbi:MAG: integrase [Bacillus thermozeamaize]|jgi:integrase|uniref:Integrase n=1 Tax=Bacillus thermozeamaize TaxID=230954 RepID=A0A1Y3PQ69_9BACI|nr:MAG: integrase [Bacillus thermozeamaize]